MIKMVFTLFSKKTKTKIIYFLPFVLFMFTTNCSYFKINDPFAFQSIPPLQIPEDLVKPKSASDVDLPPKADLPQKQ